MEYDKEIVRCQAIEKQMEETHGALWLIYLDNPSENMAKVIEMHGAVRRELATHRFWFEVRRDQQAREEAGGDG